MIIINYHPRDNCIAWLQITVCKQSDCTVDCDNANNIFYIQNVNCRVIIFDSLLVLPLTCHFFFRLFGLDGVMPLRIQNFQTSSQSMASLLLVRMSFVVVNFECKSVYNNFHIGGVCLSQSLLNSYTGLYKDEDRSMQGFTLFFFTLLCRSICISYLVII